MLAQSSMTFAGETVIAGAHVAGSTSIQSPPDGRIPQPRSKPVPTARDPFLKRCHPRNSRPLRRRPTRPISDRPPYPLETTTEFSRGGQVRPRLTRLPYLLSRTSQLHAASGSLDFLVDFSVLLLLLVTVSSHRLLAATVFMFYYFIY